MKVKIYNREVEMTEEEVVKYLDSTINDASEMHHFLCFIARYVQTAFIAGEACRGALLSELRDCMYLYVGCHKPISHIQPILEKELKTFEPEAERHHEFIRQKYGSMAKIKYPL